MSPAIQSVRDRHPLLAVPILDESIAQSLVAIPDEPHILNPDYPSFSVQSVPRYVRAGRGSGFALVIDAGVILD
jgi:hypothetical protein